MAFPTITPVLAVLQHTGVKNPEADAEKLIEGEFDNLGDLMLVDPEDLLKTLEACGLKPKSQAFLKKFVAEQHAIGASACGASAGGKSPGGTSPGGTSPGGTGDVTVASHTSGHHSAEALAGGKSSASVVKSGSAKNALDVGEVDDVLAELQNMKAELAALQRTAEDAAAHTVVAKAQAQVRRGQKV